MTEQKKTNEISREHVIHFQQFDDNNLKPILSEMDATKDDLLKNYADTNILYTLITSENGYSTSNKADFLALIDDNDNIQQVTVNVLASFDSSLNKYKKQVFLNIESYSDNTPNKNNRLLVYGDDEVWVKSHYERIKKSIEKVRKKNRLLYWSIFELFVQLTAVIAIVAVSINFSASYSTLINKPYAPVYAFIIAFFIGSNLWTYVSKFILYLRSKYYSAVGVKKKTKGVLRNIFYFVLLAVFTWGLNKLFDYFLDINLIHYLNSKT